MQFTKANIAKLVILPCLWSHAWADSTVTVDDLKPKVNKYTNDAELMSNARNQISAELNRQADIPNMTPSESSFSGDVASGHTPAGMHAESIQAVIDQTQKIKESQQFGGLAGELMEQREKLSQSQEYANQVNAIADSKSDAMRNQAQNIGKMFGSSGISASDWEQKIDQQRKEALSTETGLTIFASFSMPEYVMKDTLLEASKQNARVVFNGLKRGTENIVQTQAALKELVKSLNINPEPLVTLDPEAFTQYRVQSVPTMVYRTHNKFSQISGTLNVEYFFREIAKSPDVDIFPSAGKTFQVQERNLIEELEDRSNNYDWEGAKKRALASAWRNQYMANLPASLEHKVWYIDPTVRITKDIRDRQGNVLAHDGEMINPLSRYPGKVTMIIFDPSNDSQIQWAKLTYGQLLGNGKVMPIVTRLHVDTGWDQLNDLRSQFNGKVYLIKKEIEERFHIKATPTIVTVVGKNFRVEQLSPVDLDKASSGEPTEKEIKAGVGK